MNTNHCNPNGGDPKGGDLDEAQLTAYALGQLDEDDRAAVEAKLAASDKARLFVERTAVLAEHVYQANLHGRSPKPSPALRRAVEQRLTELEAFPMETKHDPLPANELRPGRQTGKMLALAVCLVIMGIPLYLVIAGSGDSVVQDGVVQQDAVELARVDDAAQSPAERDPARQARPQTASGPPAKEWKDDADRYAEGDVALASLEPTLVPSEAPAPTPQPPSQPELSDFRFMEPQPQPSGQQAGSQSGMALVEFSPDSSRPADAQPAAPRSEADYFGTGRTATGPQADRMPVVVAQGAYVPNREILSHDSPTNESGNGAGLGPGTGPGHGSGMGIGGGPGRGGGVGAGRKPASPGPGQEPGGVPEANRPVEVTLMDGSSSHSANERQNASVRTYGGKSTPASDSGRVTGADPRTLVKQRLVSGSLGELHDSLALSRHVAPNAPRGSAGWDIRKQEEENYAACFGTGTEQYDPIAENPFVPCEGEKAKSTFSIDVDTASYANVRRFINQGRLPPPDAVRIEEMINYFKYDYPLPHDDVPFSVNTEVADCPWNGDHRLLRIGIKGQEIDRQERGPSNLIFLLDVSGSMSSENKLPLVKRAMTMLVDQLGEDDRVGIVTYASGTEVKLESTCGCDRQEILRAIDSLSSGGSTHGSAGIQLAYERASSHFIEGGTNRVILATDGDLNVGITDDDELVKLIQQKAKTGVFLTVLGFGTGNLKDSKMEKLADKGNGTYAYIDSVREANKVLVEQLSGSLVTIAKDVKIQIEFNPAEVHSYRLIGYENRVMAAKDFRNDKKDAGEIGAGHTVTALYEIVPAGTEDVGEVDKTDRGLKYQRVAKPPLSKSQLNKQAESGELLTLWLRYKQPDEDKADELEFVVTDSDQPFGKASAEFRFASAVAAFGMVLRGSKHCGDLKPSAVEEFAAGATGEDVGGYRAEFVDLVRRVAQMRPR